MDLLASYKQEDSSTSEDEAPVPLTKTDVSIAPEVNTTGMVMYNDAAVKKADVRMLQDPKSREVMYNMPLEDMHAPLLGPSHPYQKDGISAGMKNHRSGHVEDSHMNPYIFEEQYHSFHSQGFSEAPGGEGVVGKPSNTKGAEGSAGASSSAAPLLGVKRPKTTAERKADAVRKLQKQAGDMSAPFTLSNKQPWAQKVAEVSELTEEQKEYMAKVEAEKIEGAVGAIEVKGPTSFFHGKEDKDYQGRSWLDAPKGKPKESDYTFLPKRWIHTWSGHTKGVNAVRFFPDTGHLLLSAGLDGKVKIWNVGGGGKCMRTYLGHSKGVRDIQFTNDGRRFVSTGYDKNVRVWDTETGTCLRTFNTGKIYYCVTLHPTKQNVLMGGCQDKKIYQWDIDTGDLVQEYNYHLGAVNSVTFVEGGSRFVSTSDDKSIRVWEMGIPVQVKYIADPAMHSIPAVQLHPNGNYMIGQSLDNQIVTYSSKERFKNHKNKTFKGHNTAGYACQVNFSPDGRYVLSGDAEGRCFFWEWAKPQKIVRTIKAHEGVCIGCAWHPMETSKVVTCGWDGLIKYWD